MSERVRLHLMERVVGLLRRYLSSLGVGGKAAIVVALGLGFLVACLRVAFPLQLDRFLVSLGTESSRRVDNAAVFLLAVFVVWRLSDELRRLVVYRAGHVVFCRQLVGAQDRLLSKTGETDAERADERALAVENGTQGMLDVVSNVLLVLLPLCLELVLGAFAFRSLAHGGAATIATVSIAGLLVVSVWQARPLARLEREYYASRLDAFGIYSDQLYNADLFRRYNTTSFAVERVSTLHGRLARRGERVVNRYAMVGVVHACLIAVALMALVLQAQRDDTSLTHVAAAVLLLLQLSVPAMTFGDCLLAIASGLAETDIMDEKAGMQVVEETEAASERTCETIQVDTAASVMLRNVSVVSRDEAMLLDRVTLAIPHGKTTVLTGATGSGKSTICRLLLGVQRPTSGDVVYADGLAVSGEPQQPEILFGSLRDNIRAARPDADDKDIDAAFILGRPLDQQRIALPLDTHLQQGGVHLSGGEQKLVGVARSIVADSALVVLDEPDAGLDSEYLTRLCTWVERLDCTVVLATHNPQLIETADHIVELQNGRIKSATKGS